MKIIDRMRSRRGSSGQARTKLEPLNGIHAQLIFRGISDFFSNGFCDLKILNMIKIRD